MEVKPYSQEQAKKQQVESMFDSIASSYDLLNRLLSLGIDTVWRRKAISMAEIRKPNRVIDIATGTADLALEIDKQLAPTEIVGVDISEKMLEIARKKVLKRKLDHKIEMTKGDSENLTFEDQSFDLATVAFGVRNFENLDKGLEEIYRVLQDNGQVIILEFTKPRITPFKQLFNLYFKHVLPVIGKLKSKDTKAYTYLYESVQAFPDYEEFINRMEKVGFTRNSFKSLSLGICAIYIGFKSS